MVLSALCALSSFQLKAQTPILNSYTGSSASTTPTIFLDFDGQTVTGTSWNYNGPIYCGASGLTSSQIQEVFDRIAEDYRPFTVNITTDSTKYWAAPAAKRMRIIFTVTSDWYGAAGGVSYTNSFSWGDNTPAFVFSALLGYSAKNCAEAGSHEAGHTLGLSHQSAYDANCNKISEYNAGTGSGEIAWAPIMGVGYYRNYTLWYNGANPYGCTNFQDDLSIITSSVNGISYRTDDNWNTTGNKATDLSFTNNLFTTNGIIEQSADKDVFKITIPSTSRFTLNAAPYSVTSGNTGADLDMQVDLLDRQGNLINSYNPSTQLSAAIDTNLSNGSYYIRVQGASNTYATNYASLGSYTLTGTMSAALLPVHELRLRGSNDGNRHSLNWVVEADETIVSQVIEVSTDGINFSPLNHVSNDARSLSYVPTRSGSLYYRLNVAFDNGRQYYSNTIGLRVSSTSKPYLVSTVIYGSNLAVNSPYACSYTVSDFSGKQIMQGKLTQGNNMLNSGMMASGLYVIRYFDGQEQFVEKFVKN